MKYVRSDKSGNLLLQPENESDPSEAPIVSGRRRMKPYQKRVYELLHTVPRGKVTTYGEIARVLGMSPRVVGTALHLNPDNDDNPCHRVVNRDGRVAPGFAFGGPGIQRQLLEAEGVKFVDDNHVDLSNYLFTFAKKG